MILTSAFASVLGDWRPVIEGQGDFCLHFGPGHHVPSYRKETNNGQMRANQALFQGGELYDSFGVTEAQSPIRDAPADFTSTLIMVVMLPAP